MKEEILEDIGLSPNEAKIYISLLDLGMSTVTNIANITKIHRANVYDSLKKLIDKSLVSHIRRDNTTFYEAASPKSLLRLVKEKENKVLSILPQLLLSKKLASAKGEAKIYEGVSAFVNILYEFLENNKPILVYGIPKIAPEIMKTKIPHFHKERISRKIRMDHIYNHDATDRIKFLKKMPYTTAKKLPQQFESQVSTNICGDEVAIVIWSKEVMTIRIRNDLIADSYKRHFEVLWSAAN